MTVRDYIALLSELDPELPVIQSGGLEGEDL